MTIHKDSGHLLVFIYGEYLKDANFLGVVNDISKKLKWDLNKTLRASNYLSDSKMVETDDSGYIILRILPAGIDIVEDNNKFKVAFGVNLGFFNISLSEE